MNIPITGSITAFNINPFTIGAFDTNLKLGLTITVPLPSPLPDVTVPIEIPLDGDIGPIEFPGTIIDTIPLTLVLGPTPIHIPIVGGGGPIVVPVINIPAGPGLGNWTDTLSSGFFHGGAGGDSGFFNTGGLTSGIQNGILGAIGNSGYKNLGSLESGLANLGNSVSGFFNTSSLDMMTAAFNSGLGNVGQNLSGVFFQGTGP